MLPFKKGTRNRGTASSVQALLLLSVGATLLWHAHTATAYTCKVYNDTFITNSKVTIPFQDKLPVGKNIDPEKYSQGAKALFLVKMFRKNANKEYYAQVLKAIMITYCERRGDKERYVEIGTADAAMNSDASDCLTAGDSNPPAPSGSYCERVENCYWGPIDPNADREPKYTDEEAAAAQKLVKSYVIGLGYVLAPGVILGVFNLLGMLIVAIARCCCRKCGARPVDTGYSRCQRWLPVLFYVIFSIGVLLSAVIAFLGNVDVDTGILQVFQAIANGFLRFGRFLSRASAPLFEVAKLTNQAVNDTSDLVSSSGWVVPMSSTANDRALEFKQLYGVYTDFPFVNSSVTEISAYSVNQVEAVAQTVVDSLATLKDSMVGIQSTVVAAVGGVATMMETLNVTASSGEETIFTYQGIQANYSLYQYAGVLALFALSVILLLLGWCGVGAGLTPCTWDNCFMVFMHCTWTIGTLVVTLSFIISGLALVLGVFWYDACNFLDVVTSDFGDFVPSDMAAEGLTACFNGSSLLVTFNLTQYLSFGDSLSTGFSYLSDLNSTKVFGNISHAISDLDYSLSQFNTTSYVLDLNYYTDSARYDASAGCSYDDTYTWANLDTPWNDNTGKGTTAWTPTQSYARQTTESALTYMTRLYQNAACGNTINDAIISTWTTASDTKALIKEMRQNTGDDSTFCASNTCPASTFKYSTSIAGQNDLYWDNITTLFTDIQGVALPFAGAISDQIEEFKCNAYCTWVKDTFDEVTAGICTTLLGGFLQIGLALFFLSIFMFSIVVLTLVLKTRLGLPDRVYVEEEFVPVGERRDEYGEDGQARAVEGDEEESHQQHKQSRKSSGGNNVRRSSGERASLV